MTQPPFIKGCLVTKLNPSQVTALIVPCVSTHDLHFIYIRTDTIAESREMSLMILIIILIVSLNIIHLAVHRIAIGVSAFIRVSKHE